VSGTPNLKCKKDRRITWGPEVLSRYAKHAELRSTRAVEIHMRLAEIEPSHTTLNYEAFEELIRLMG
jgi:hypothetical protein